MTHLTLGLDTLATRDFTTDGMLDGVDLPALVGLEAEGAAPRFARAYNAALSRILAAAEGGGEEWMRRSVSPAAATAFWAAKSPAGGSHKERDQNDKTKASAASAWEVEARELMHRAVDEMWDHGEFADGLQSSRRRQNLRWRTAVLKATAINKGTAAREQN